ncbi:MAG: diguanylate cyclase [Myxococcales bacterium]|jgi:diguanylate cyclase (GGDEF)-like protein
MAEQAKPKILVVDDDDDIVWMITAVLRKEFDVVSASNGKSALTLLEGTTVEGIIADHMMPGMSGVEMLDRSHELLPSAARILITASERVNVLKDAVNRARVHRFLSKPLRLTELPSLLSEAIREAHLEAENIRLVEQLELKNRELERANEQLEEQVKQRTRELEAAIEQLEEMALRDGLTGLYNHRFLQEALDAELSRAERHGHALGLLFIDVDHFKHYNDHNGHPAGDRLLKRLAAVLTGGRESGLPVQGRRSDVVARYGGEEFVMVLPETTPEGAEIKAERIRRTIAEYPFRHAEGQPLGCVSVSVGVACFPRDGGDRQTLIDVADRELYRAKHGGRNRVCVAGEE